MSREESNHVNGNGPPADLPRDAGSFWGESLPELPRPSRETPMPLRQLGGSPFPKAGFPVLGFLESIYEHIATRASEAEKSKEEAARRQ